MFGNLNANNPAGLDHILGQSPPRVIEAVGFTYS